MSNFVPRSMINTLRNDGSAAIQQSFDKFFNQFFEEFFDNGSGSINLIKEGVKYPKIDVIENDNTFVVKASVPGFKKENLNITISTESNGTGRCLNIVGIKEPEPESNESNTFLIRELRLSSFRRYLQLPLYVKGEPDVSLQDGILTLIWKIQSDETKPSVQIIKIKD